MKRLCLLLLLLAWPAHGDDTKTPAPAAGPIVTLKKTIEADPGDLVEVTAESGAELVSWDASEGLRIVYPKADATQKKVFIHSKVSGTYALVASIPNGKETRVAICIVTIGPRPPPPTPVPVPPGPVPPGPTPVPVPTKEFRVLFVYERQANLTRQQENVMSSTAVRKYLDSHVVKGESGLPDYRYFDQNQDVTKDTATIQAMFKAAKPMFTGKPLVVIFDGTKGTSYPLPDTEAELLALLKKAGGE